MNRPRIPTNPRTTMSNFDRKLEMAILVALTYAYVKTRKVGETRERWMERVGYLLAADLYIR